MKAYEWLIHYYVKEAKTKEEQLTESGMTEMMAKGVIFYDYTQMLATAYVEYTIIKCFKTTVQEANSEIKNVLTDLLEIYATSAIQKFSTTLYYGELATVLLFLITYINYT